jgi:hypothetical protein
MTFASGAVLCSIEGAVGADTESCCPNARIWSERALGVFQQYPSIRDIASTSRLRNYRTLPWWLAMVRLDPELPYEIDSLNGR